MIRTPIRMVTSTVALLIACSPLAAFAGTPVDVKIEGMTCSSCVESVNKELGKLDELEKGSVKVSLKGNHANVVLKNDDAKTRQAVTDAITKAGFKVAKIDVVPTTSKPAAKTN